ncbi:MAG: DUF2971 domain-containing protein [Sulfurimonas sp.]|nr:DUF2971 domain-containing protein [Sulfurimonas sp.]
MIDWNNKIESGFPKSDYRSRDFSGYWTKHFINDFVDSIFNSGIVETQEKYADYKNEHLPKSLFKFFPPSEYSLINLENNSLFLSSPRNFNDPFDSFVCIEAEKFKKIYLLKKLKELNLISKEEQEDKISEKEYYELYYSWTKETEPPFIPNKTRPMHFIFALFDIRNKKNGSLSSLLYEIVEEARRECRKKIDYIRNMEFKISCFSNFEDETELLKNTSMWSHYAGNHQGFSIKYKTDFNNVINGKAIRCGLFPIHYTAKVPQISPRELMRLKLSGEEYKLNKPVLKTAYKTMTTKSRSWSYEKEWRLILSNYDSDILTNNTIPFLEAEAIFLGARIESNLKKFLVQIAEKKEIPIYQTKLSNETFELRLEDLYLRNLEEDEYRTRNNIIYQFENQNDRQEKMNLLNKERYNL